MQPEASVTGNLKKPRSYGIPGDDSYREIVKADRAPEYKGPPYFVSVNGDELTPKRCREYADWLLKAADWIEQREAKDAETSLNKARAYEEVT